MKNRREHDLSTMHLHLLDDRQIYNREIEICHSRTLKSRLLSSVNLAISLKLQRKHNLPPDLSPLEVDLGFRRVGSRLKERSKVKRSREERKSNRRRNPKAKRRWKQYRLFITF
ncbi:unnamed protein product [Brassica rapa]|uniref:Uncharacterized protein n=2 Tax=Brassica TaxID=3705 RepID=A0A8D9GBY1_BRACM|nr:unnamed protein product [Brassica napus]CAG7875594.1 unnamed protein product [Brassica rapa]